MSKIEDQVCEKILRRAEFGLVKYGAPLENTGLTEKEVLIHAQEEAMDLANYLETILEKKKEQEGQMAKINLLDKGYVEFIESWGSDRQIIESARMSTNKGFQGWGTDEKPGDEKLLKYLWDNKHSTPFEMAGLTLEVKAPIMVFREWHRHRTQSYNEMSARYTPLPDENYMPAIARLLNGANSATSNKQAANSDGQTLSEQDAAKWMELLNESYALSESVYETGLRLGIPKELARLPVPVARYSRMRVSANLRNWLAFLTLRMDDKAQYEIRVYANAICEIISQHFPRTHNLFV